MTIVEAIKTVLQDSKSGMTSKEIYEEIIQRNLYDFPAQNPQAVVNGMIRRHCKGLYFATASPIKHFSIERYTGKQTYYTLLGQGTADSSSSKEICKSGADALPEEQIQRAYEKHLFDIKSQLLNTTMENPPSFFEHLIVDLLLKMGYGYDQTSAKVVGGPHDAGIDGIISEDKLGLDLIYLQAKRYKKENTVGRKELQAFVGAMQNVQKGVFITTSSFTRDAVKYAEGQQQKSLKLIDGDLLSSLMIKYEIGIVVQTPIKIYRVDNTYFE